MEPSIRIDVDQRIKGSFLKEPERTVQIFNEEFGRAMTGALLFLKREIQKRTPVRTGTLRGSIAEEIRGTGLNMQGVVGTPVIYALPIEHGTKRYWPPFTPLGIWAKREGIGAKIGRPDASLQELGFIVSRQIARQGIRARHMFTEGFEASKSTILKMFKEAQLRILNILERG